MDNLRKRCENLYWDMHQGYYSHGEVTKLFDLIESFAREIRNEALEEAAIMAFEKVRCDDRTDRWQVANEVAAHIRALAQQATVVEEK